MNVSSDKIVSINELANLHTIYVKYKVVKTMNCVLNGVSSRRQTGQSKGAVLA